MAKFTRRRFFNGLAALTALTTSLFGGCSKLATDSSIARDKRTLGLNPK